MTLVRHGDNRRGSSDGSERILGGTSKPRVRCDRHRATPVEASERTAMTYTIMKFGCVGATVQGRTPESIARMPTLLQPMDRELRESGRLVDERRLVDPSQARDDPTDSNPSQQPPRTGRLPARRDHESLPCTQNQGLHCHRRRHPRHHRPPAPGLFGRFGLPATND
jgi:hypothetical protein